MRFLITGGCGFLGANLASEVLKRGEELFVIDNLSRVGSVDNLRWLEQQGNISFFQKDIRNTLDVGQIVQDVRPDIVFHLAGQVAMTTSIDDPRLDFEINVVGGFNILNAVRMYVPDAIVTYSSTNKVYGDLHCRLEETDTRYIAVDYPNGFGEDLSLDFQGPYGCSKGAVDQYMLDFARVFGLKTVVFRHSSIFGGRQFATFDQGWIGWFVKEALAIKSGKKQNLTVSGTGKQVRDVLFASDLVACYFRAIERIDFCKGQAFNIGGGADNSLSIIELFKLLEEKLETHISFSSLPWRKSDQKVFIADIQKAKNVLGWEPSVNKETGVSEMVAWVIQST
jgi:CDP-paratose 2-epimerase